MILNLSALSPFRERARGYAGTVVLVALCLAGCKGGEEEADGPSFTPKKVVFEGKLDPKYSGIWKSTDGDSSLVLTKEGSMTIDQKITAANGKSTSHVQGTWLSSGKSLLFKYPENSGGDTTIEYSAKLNGNTLILGQAGGRMKTTYNRK